MLTAHHIKSALLGITIGDALGVPVEFSSRESLTYNPVIDMRGYGTFNQPPGTWSDDSSLSLCLAEALIGDFTLEALAENFVQWYRDAYWTAHGEMFDVGIATAKAIERLESGIKPDFAGGDDESSNGNGSLMRILPLLFHIRNLPIEQRFSITSKVSSVTHRHMRSVIACFYYLEFARLILEGMEITSIYIRLQSELPAFLESQVVDKQEIEVFSRLLNNRIDSVSIKDISSSGYVVHTLESSIYCLMTTTNYKDAVLKAVNLGEDTDTTAAVTGGLAGLVYGYGNIPAEWLKVLVRRGDIEDLAERLAVSYSIIPHKLTDTDNN